MERYYERSGIRRKTKRRLSSLTIQNLSFLLVLQTTIIMERIFFHRGKGNFIISSRLISSNLGISITLKYTKKGGNGKHNPPAPKNKESYEVVFSTQMKPLGLVG